MRFIYLYLAPCFELEELGVFCESCFAQYQSELTNHCLLDIDLEFRSHTIDGAR